jgi:hypothetical protein
VKRSNSARDSAKAERLAAGRDWPDPTKARTTRSEKPLVEWPLLEVKPMRPAIARSAELPRA